MGRSEREIDLDIEFIYSEKDKENIEKIMGEWIGTHLAEEFKNFKA